MNHIKSINDNWTLKDFIGHKHHIKAVSHIIESCEPPYVLGIHGDWGAGKTSFLRKLHLCLAGEDCGYDNAADEYNVLWEDACKPINDIETIWFDAWHYQFENNPAVALLNEIRAHFTLSRKFFNKAEKFTYAALMALDDLSKKIGASPSKITAAGEKWEKEHFSQPLPSQMIKDLMEDAIGNLLGKEPRKRLVIFVDDLDRCTGPVAFRFIEAMKVYFSLSNCVFVLGLDVRHIRRAVAAELKKAGVIPESSEENGADKAEIYASDYLGKMFQHVFYLPVISNFRTYLTYLMENSGLQEPGKWIEMILEYELLPSNPRKIKAFVNSLTFYTDQLTDRIEKFNQEKEPEDKIHLDRKLALIMIYLRLMAHDIHRILETEPDFWSRRLVEFCKTGQYQDSKGNSHWALKKLTHCEIATPLSGGEEGYEYESSFPDPSDESLFRAARLIRENESVTADEFKIYLLRGE